MFVASFGFAEDPSEVAGGANRIGGTFGTTPTIDVRVWIATGFP